MLSGGNSGGGWVFPKFRFLRPILDSFDATVNQRKKDAFGMFDWLFHDHDNLNPFAECNNRPYPMNLVRRKCFNL